MANRHLSRSIVLQSLFAWDFGGKKKDDLKETVEYAIKEFAPGIDDTNFIYDLVFGIEKKLPEIDALITTSAPDWPLEQITNVDRNVLRIGIYELKFAQSQDVPPKVAI